MPPDASDERLVPDPSTMAIQARRSARARPDRHSRIDEAGGRRQARMTEQHLDDADVGPGLEQMRRKAVPQGMDCHRLA